MLPIDFGKCAITGQPFSRFPVIFSMITYAEFWIFTACLLGVLQCTLLGAYFLFLKEGDPKAHRIFVLLMTLLAVRLLKSAYYLFVGEAMSVFWMNIGFAAHAAAAPVALLYVRSQLGEAPTTSRWLYHLLPACALLLLAPWLTTANFWYLGGYRLLLLYTLVYFGLLVHLWWQYRPAGQLGWWIPKLLLGLGLFFGVYFSNYVLRIIPYAMAPVVYSIGVLPISLSAWKRYQQLQHQETPENKVKYGNLRQDDGQLTRLADQVLAHLQQQKPYLDPAFQQSELARQCGVPPQMLSMLLSKYLEQSFPTLVNRLRVEEACRLLSRSDLQHYSIAAVAFEAGFNSLSVFNQQFKRQTGFTPSAYRKTYFQ